MNFLAILFSCAIFILPFQQQFRLYASDMCGMLREKEILIGELQSAVLEHLKAQATHRFDYWKKRQDMILDCMRQVSFKAITLQKVTIMKSDY